MPTIFAIFALTAIAFFCNENFDWKLGPWEFTPYFKSLDDLRDYTYGWNFFWCKLSFENNLNFKFFYLNFVFQIQKLIFPIQIKFKYIKLSFNFIFKSNTKIFKFKKIKVNKILKIIIILKNNLNPSFLANFYLFKWIILINLLVNKIW